MKQMFPQQQIVFLTNWFKLEFLGEKQLRLLGLVVIEVQNGAEGRA